jgi:hypothetical protein
VRRGPHPGACHSSSTARTAATSSACVRSVSPWSEAAQHALEDVEDVEAMHFRLVVSFAAKFMWEIQQKQNIMHPVGTVGV